MGYTKEQLKELWPKIPYDLQLYHSVFDEQFIFEYLNNTILPGKTTRDLYNKFSHEILAELDEDKILLNFKTLKFDILDPVNKFMDSYGWYPSNAGNDKESLDLYKNVNRYFNRNNVYVEYQAKWNKKVITNNRYLYHITPDLKVKPISVLGLTPKTQGKISNDPGRIYFIETPTDLKKYNTDLHEIAIDLYKSYKNKQLVKNMCVLRIDLSKIPNIQFYEDPKAKEWTSIWTYQNIPPAAIEVIEDINMGGVYEE